MRMGCYLVTIMTVLMLGRTVLVVIDMLVILAVLVAVSMLMVVGVSCNRSPLSQKLS